MNVRRTTYQVAGATWRLSFNAESLAMLRKSVQRGVFSKESVGQLYARDFTTDTIEIVCATKLRPRWASFAKVTFDPTLAMAERERLFKDGLHCIGLWHTHPEPNPSPSSDDLALAEEHARAARPQLKGLVFAIVGNSGFPGALRVWVHDGVQLLVAARQT